MSSVGANPQHSNYRQAGIRSLASVKIEVAATPEQFALWLLTRPGRLFWNAGAALSEFLTDISGAAGIRPKGTIWCELMRVRFGRRGVTAVELLAAVDLLRPVAGVDQLADVAAEENPEDVIDRARPSPLHGRWFTKDEIERAIGGTA